jgi:Cu(I)/Ag(I) efflux system membrane protein CusA/SilA
MWSARAGAEVMKPLATPVLGGMISSLLHVLVVTPVIFYWMRARRLPPEDSPPGLPGFETRASHARAMTIGAVAVVLALVVGWIQWGSKSASTPSAGLTEIRSVTSGDMRVVLLSAESALEQGRSEFTIEFRNASGTLVDVGTVTGAASMYMPGMPMSGGLRIEKGTVPGRYRAVGDFAMSGAWQFTIEWQGTSPGTAAFEGVVR